MLRIFENNTVVFGLFPPPFALGLLSREQDFSFISYNLFKKFNIRHPAAGIIHNSCNERENVGYREHGKERACVRLLNVDGKERAWERESVGKRENMKERMRERESEGMKENGRESARERERP